MTEERGLRWRKLLSGSLFHCPNISTGKMIQWSNDSILPPQLFLPTLPFMAAADTFPGFGGRRILALIT
jgi:hypothetical protein